MLFFPSSRVSLSADRQASGTFRFVFENKLRKWIGKGEVNRPLWQYLKTKVSDFEVDKFGLFNGVFVASGTKKK